MRRLAAIFLAFGFFCIGSGAMESLHNVRHAMEDRQADAVARAHGQPIHHENHDDSNCEVHAQLHAPLLSVAWVPLLVLLGLFVAFLTELPHLWVAYRPLLRLDCRGPPLLLPS